MFEYDVAISFAGEQRKEAEAIAQRLTDAHVKVFYDNYERANLWGKDLFEHLSVVYEKRARYCLMLISQAYADKIWATHERRSAQARAITQGVEYILPVRFDSTEIPGLLHTVGFLNFADHGIDGICSVLLDKLNGTQATAPKRQLVEAPNEYHEQRRRMPSTALMDKIWARPRWRISIYPTEFKKARFRNPEHCKQFVSMAQVEVHGLLPYPQFSKDTLAIGREWIVSETENSDASLFQAERWLLFQSALFADNRTFRERAHLADRIHALEILDITTSAFEFAARMAQFVSLAPTVALDFELHDVAGKQLTWPQDIFMGENAVPQYSWCQEDFMVRRQVAAVDIAAQSRQLALEATIEIYSEFGWVDPPRDRLSEEQRRRFGLA